MLLFFFLIIIYLYNNNKICIYIFEIHHLYLVFSTTTLLYIYKKKECGHYTVYGTDLALKLRQHLYQGLILIRSANSTNSDFEFYKSNGAIDACLNKSQTHKELKNQIEKIYFEVLLKNRKRKNSSNESDVRDKNTKLLKIGDD